MPRAKRGLLIKVVFPHSPQTTFLFNIEPQYYFKDDPCFVLIQESNLVTPHNVFKYGFCNCTSNFGNLFGASIFTFSVHFKSICCLKMPVSFHSMSYIYMLNISLLIQESVSPTLKCTIRCSSQKYRCLQHFQDLFLPLKTCKIDPGSVEF